VGSGGEPVTGDAAAWSAATATVTGRSPAPVGREMLEGSGGRHGPGWLGGLAAPEGSRVPAGQAGPARQDPPDPDSAVPAPTNVDRLAKAITELAVTMRNSPDGEASAGELAGRLASLWAMVADLDPAVAARLSGYPL
jgi:hypothetical protein